MPTQTGSYDFKAAKAVQDNLDAKNPYIEQNNTGSDTWTGEAPTLSALEDGQEIAFWHNTNWANKGYVNTTNYWSQNGSALNLTLADGTKTGAVPIWYNGNTRLTSHYQSGSLIQMVYKEGYLHPGYAESHRVARGWYCKANYYTDTVYSRSISGGFYTGANGVLSYGLCMKDSSGRWTAIVNNKYSNTTQDKTAYTGGLQLGEVLYCSTWYSNGRVTTNNTSVAGDLWASNIFDFRFCTNISANTTAGKALTVRKPVYLVGSIGTDGLFYLDKTQWWTQTEPTANNNNVYIYLGTAYSWYQLALVDNKPIYVFRNSKWQLYEKWLADEAAKVAGNYIVSTAANDVWIHTEDHGPNSSGAATTNTYGWRIGSVFELVRAGLSYLKMWVDGTVAKVRVGLESAGHSIFSPSGMEVFTDATTSVAFFGTSGTTPTSRIGKTAGPRAVIVPSGMDIYGASDGSVNLVHFGYAPGVDGAGDEKTAPYYTLGERSGGIGNYSVVEGRSTASGYMSHAEGSQATASGQTSHAEGEQTTASGWASHAEGEQTTASNSFSHAEGEYSKASGESSHAEGFQGLSSGDYSHTEGYYATASNDCAHAEGYHTTASGKYSHAQNIYTKASSSYQTAMGRYNVEDTSYTYALIVGNGTSDTERSNAAALKWDGTLVLAKALPIASGGTGLTASPSMLTNLGSTTAANVLQASPRPGITGTLGIGNGGTGMTGVTSGSSGVVTAASGTTIVTQSYVKWGKMCQLYVTFKRTSKVHVPASGNITNIKVFTLNNGFKPKIASAGWSNGDGAGAAWYTVGTGGDVNIGAMESKGSAWETSTDDLFSFHAVFILP